VATRVDITAKLADSLTPEQARDARVRAWSYVFECWQKKQNAADETRTGGENDARRIKNACTAE
jgi:hypothetical protein